jgi:hypothetical protein
LPPAGEGTFLINVEPKEGLSDGTTIGNAATVKFDNNPLITTNTWIDTVDNTPPISSVDALPPVERSGTFSMTWAGTDTSGVVGYDIYVSENGEAPTRLGETTGNTQTLFTGSPGNTYSFYTVARDGAGNVEAPPSSPDAATIIDVPPSFATGVADTHTTQYSDPITPFTITANDADDDPDTLSISGAGLPLGLDLVDNHDGSATITGTVAAVPGVYTPQYTVSDANGPTTVLGGAITVTKEDTTTVYTGASGSLLNGSTVTLAGALREDGLTPISDRPLTLTLGVGPSSQSCTSTTDTAGLASCAITITQQPGPGTVGASFAGDAFYEGSSDSKPTLIVASNVGRGSFVIGDGNAGMGQAVTFWGAQWSKRNLLSHGSAPAAFKGFAKNPALPACGVNWSTGPGGSASPPAAPLPAYINVVVTDYATKAGSAISGNTVRVVVVKTNAGYDGTLDHAGTGTVVGTLC